MPNKPKSPKLLNEFHRLHNIITRGLPGLLHHNLEDREPEENIARLSWGYSVTGDRFIHDIALKPKLVAILAEEIIPFARFELFKLTGSGGNTPLHLMASQKNDSLLIALSGMNFSEMIELLMKKNHNGKSVGEVALANDVIVASINERWDEAQQKPFLTKIMQTDGLRDFALTCLDSNLDLKEEILSRPIGTYKSTFQMLATSDDDTAFRHAIYNTPSGAAIIIWHDETLHAILHANPAMENAMDELYVYSRVLAPKKTALQSKHGDALEQKNVSDEPGAKRVDARFVPAPH